MHTNQTLRVDECDVLRGNLQAAFIVLGTFALVGLWTCLLLLLT